MTNTKKPAAKGRGFFYAWLWGRGLAYARPPELSGLKVLLGTDVQQLSLRECVF